MCIRDRLTPTAYKKKSFSVVGTGRNENAMLIELAIQNIGTVEIQSIHTTVCHLLKYYYQTKFCFVGIYALPKAGNF